MAKMLNPQTGATGDVTIDRLQEALRDGMQLAEPVELYNPETKGSGLVPPDKAASAMADGLVPVGSHAHKVATTGYLESGLRGAAQGASLGFADEITGAAEHVLTGKPYAQARDESRANYDVAHEANPKTSIAGELVGGAASMALPGGGVGRLAKGASLAQEALLGAKLGAVSGLGNSRADLTEGDVSGAARDTIHGAEFGGVAGGVLGGATRAVGGATKAVGNLATQAFDPVTQRLLALGATKKNFMGPLGDKSAKAVEVFKREGLFEKLADGSEPELADIAQIAEARRRQAADKLGQLFSAAGGKRVPLNDLDDSLRAQFDQIIHNTPSDLRGTMSDKAEGLLDDLYNTGGNIEKLWDLKKRTGGWAGKAWEATGQIPTLKEMFMKANQTLDDVLEVETANFAKQHGLPRMSELNDTYGAMATLGRVMEDKIARGAVKDPLNTKLRDASILSVAGGAIGSAVAGPVGAGLGAAAGGIAGQSLSSTSGRLMRARIGEKLHIGQQAQDVANGAMPRSTPGIQKFLAENFQSLSTAFPQLAQGMQDIITSPAAKAESAIRMMMPMLMPYMAHSPFNSELDGKVSAPEDKQLATKMIEQLQLPPSAMALRMSLLNKQGTLPSEIWVPAPKVEGSDPIMDGLESFNARLGKMGY